jgi:hypothetical protein
MCNKWNLLNKINNDYLDSKSGEIFTIYIYHKVLCNFTKLHFKVPVEALMCKLKKLLLV